MLPIEILVHITKLSKTPIASKVILAFNIKNYEDFIDMLVTKHRDNVRIFFMVYDKYHYRHGPAIRYSSGAIEYYRKGLLHRGIVGNERSAGPAVIHPNGTRIWYQHGKIHREENECFRNPGPAIIYPDGAKHWYRYGQQHRGVARNDFPQNVIVEEYYRNVLGNEDFGNLGPASIHPNGEIYWYVNGTRIIKTWNPHHRKKCNIHYSCPPWPKRV